MEHAKGPSIGFTIAIVFCMFLYAGYAGLAYLPPKYWPRHERTYNHINSCIANLKQLDSAKEQWAMDNHKPAGTNVTFSDLVGSTLYLKAKPTCVIGGTYSINAVGKNPSCSTPGHELP